MPQSLKCFSLRPYTLDDRMWAGITRQTSNRTLDATRYYLADLKNFEIILKYTKFESYLLLPFP